MNRVQVTNGLALLGAVAATLALAWPRPRTDLPRAARAQVAPVLAPPRVRLPSGEWAIADASGTEVPLRHYDRIVSTNFTVDRLLIELCEPNRIRAVSRGARERKRDGYRYAGFEVVDGFGPLEPILLLKPDLVLLNSFGDAGTAHRLRVAGVQVFDLGALQGVGSLTRAAMSIGELLGEPERARRFLASFDARMHNVSAALPSGQRGRAIFLAVLGPQLMLGGADTPYHDIMVAAGLDNAAAPTYRGWPSLSPEQVLALAPEIIVTREGTAEALCHYPGMQMLGPCRGKGRIVELAGDLLDEAGPGMLDAAESLFAIVHGAR